MKDIDEKFMQVALKEAKLAHNIGEIPIGAVIVKNGIVIASGHNLVEKKGSVIYHAEIEAIKKATKKLKDWRLLDCDIYVTLEPCPMCAGAIVQSRIKRVIYAVSDDKGSSREIFESGRYNHKTECVFGLLQKECMELLQSFFKERRKKEL